MNVEASNLTSLGKSECIIGVFFFFFSYDVFESICIIGVSNVSSDIVFYIAYVIQNSDCHTHA
jgi:hypothetical protein